MSPAKKVVTVIGMFCVVISAAGCANKEVVKKEEPVALTAASAKPVAPAAKATPGMNKDVTAAKAAPATQAKAVTAPVVEKKVVTQAAFEKIYFDFDSSDLSKSARDVLTHNADVLMKDQKAAKLRIEGNCDERGSAEYNMALGERRAKAAAKYLATLGVQAGRLSVISYGKEKPAVQGNDEAAWAKDRRDEFVIVR